MPISVPIEQVRANEAQVAPLREECVPAGVWTVWDREIAKVGLERLASVTAGKG